MAPNPSISGARLAVAGFAALAVLAAVVAGSPPVRARAAVPAVPTASSTGPRLTVDVAAGHHAISPEIYGVNFALVDLNASAETLGPAAARQLGVTVDRWGGNSTDTYNWQEHAVNTGNDYFFEDIPDCWSHDQCSGAFGQDYSASDDAVRSDRDAGLTSLVTLPMVGWVPKPHDVTGGLLCSYPTDVYAGQDAGDPYWPCGNGRVDGAPITADPTRAQQQVDAPSYDAAWVHHFVAEQGTAADGGVAIYELGNEPMLWDSTHRDVHPDPVSYDELWQTSRDTAAAVKAADPSAAVLGPSEWGWVNYFCSAVDIEQAACDAAAPDRAAHGGEELAAWYLQQFRKHEQQTGDRLLDYLDLHVYPQTLHDDVYAYSPATDVTRILWDPTYTDPSWVNDQIRLIPRMRAWVAQDYPGTKTAITEYNFGLVAQGDARLQNVIGADALGIFGREGLDLATFFSLGGSPLPRDAFRIFRNYDGDHHGFGSLGVAASSTDESDLAVYAARRGAHGPLTLVVVNKTGHDLTSSVGLVHSGLGGPERAKAWQYAGHGVDAVGRIRVGRRGFSATFPQQSVTMVVVPLPR